MAAGRNQVDYSEIGVDEDAILTVKIDNATITYDATKAGASAQVGLAVTWSADDTIALCADGDYVLGKLLRVTDDLFAAVQVEGFCQLAGGNAATLTRGTAIVGALGAASAKGYIRSVNTAVAAEMGKQNARIHNVADATAVWVNLG